MSAALALDGAGVMLGGRPVLAGVDLEIHPGEVVGVVGPNGAGKTTLLRAALGLIKLSDGVARLAGREVTALTEAERASLAGYLPQERRAAWNLPAWRVAALGAWRVAPSEARTAALAAMAELGVAALAERGINDMSGGERARTLIARLLATGAPLLAADEPAAGLDPAAALLVMDVFRQRADKGAAVIVTLHDLTLAARACDRVAVMSGGRLAAVGVAAEALSPAVLAEVFALEGALANTDAGPVLAARARSAKAGPDFAVGTRSDL